MAASGRPVSRTNTRVPKANRVRATRTPLAAPEIQSSIERLRTKYGTSGRTLSQESLGQNLEISQKRNRAERKLENQVLRTLPTRGEALKAAPKVRKSTQLNAEGTRVERLAGATQVGNEGLRAVRGALRRGKVKRRGNQFTTPKVRRVERKVKRAKRQVQKARAKARSGITGPLTPGQKKFVQEFTKRTGINPRVAGAWVLSEMSGQYAQGREADGNHNWLNINYNDSGPGPITQDPAWSNPVSAAKASAQFLKGKRWAAGANIPDILPRSRGASDEAQIQAIAESGWASSGYESGNSLRRTRDLIGYKPPSGKAKARVARAEARAESVGKEAARLGIEAEGLFTPQVARELGLREPENAGVPPKIVKGFKGMVGAAKQLEAWGLPYVWGGGHGTSKVGDPRQYGGLDCSSTVSHILQQGGIRMPTVVSGAFGQYTKPGPGAITILYNPTHVLMKIGNRYFGTSGTNPGGGPGWLDKSLGDSEMASGKYNIGHVPGFGPEVAKRMNLDPDSYRNFPGMSVSGNTATANSGTVSYTPTFSDRPIVAGDGQGKATPRQMLRRLGYDITSQGIRRTGLAAGISGTDGEEETVSTSQMKRRYGVK